MSTINMRRALTSYPGSSLMGVTKRIYKMVDVNTVLYIANITSANIVERGVGLYGVTLTPVNTAGTPVAQPFKNKSYFRRFFEQIKCLVKDLNEGKIFIYDPIEYPCITTRYPTTLEAMYNGITGSTAFTVETGTIDEVAVVKIKPPTGVTPKTGIYSLYGTEDLTAKIGTASKDVYCLDGNIIVVPNTTDTYTEIKLSIPGFSTVTITMPEPEQEPEPEPEPEQEQEQNDTPGGGGGGGST